MSTIKTGTTLTTSYQVVGDTTGALVIQTGATPTTAMTIDTSQNVGIGTGSPVTKLQVANGNVTATGYSFLGASSAALGVVTTNAALHAISSDTTTYGYGISTNNSGGLDIMANQASQPIRFWCGTSNASPTKRLTLDPSGNVLVHTANAGIVFNKTGALNNSTLNDYEEGTWTPNIGGTATYLSQIGVYTKVGRMVTVQCDLYINVRGTGSTTQVYGLPFAAAPGNYYSANVVYFANLTGNVFWIQGIVPIGGTPQVYFETITSTAGQASANDASAIFQSTSRIIFTATYFTA